MPHRILNYDGELQYLHNGNRVLSFSYARQEGNIISDWNAEMAGGNYTAGDSFQIDIMKKGVITSVVRDSEGKVLLEGKDAGIRFMRPCPAPSSFVEGGFADVIADVCEYCDMEYRIVGELTELGFNARAVITGTTCADVILELALLAGKIAYIDNDGKLVLATPTISTPTLPVALSEGSTSLNTDGYATQVGVLLTRRLEEEEDEDEGNTYYNGTTPSGSTTTQSDSGSFGDGDVSGSWMVEKIMPLNIIKRSECVVTHGSVTTRFTENHSYDIETKVVWRGDQEYRLFAYIETGYSIVKNSSGSYQGATGIKTFEEITSETMSRSISIFDDPAIFDEWKGELGRVDNEIVERSTVRTGGPGPQAGDPPNSPPFDERIERVYERTNFGATLVCIERSERYEKRTIGRNSGVTLPNGSRYQASVGGVLKNLNVTGDSFPEWVLVRSTRVLTENYDDNGEVAFSSSTSYDDDGAAHLMEARWYIIGDPTMDTITEEYLKFTEKSNGIDASVSGGGIMPTMWQFLELAGREKVTTDGGINANEWYNNGDYIQTLLCPHFYAQTCRISNIETVPPMSGTKCPYRGLGWRKCVRAIAALEQARREEDQALLAPPVYGEAGSEGVQYVHELTVEEILTDEQAQTIANAIAANILRVKSTKGIVRTVAIPYDPSIAPNNGIIGVSHDVADLQTTVSFLEDRPIPLFLLPGDYSTAVNASGRELSRRDRPRIGTVASIDKKTVYVRIGSVIIPCTSKLKGVGVGDSVEVTMPGGTSSFGVITDRL